MTVYFPEVTQVSFEGTDSTNPLAFRHYNPKEVVGDKTMEEHLRFSMAYWHTLTGAGDDMFGSGSVVRPWDNLTDPMDIAKARAYASFEFMQNANSFFLFPRYRFGS